ncbi:MAG: retropepsin-like aspartic protease [Ginsengibacter sp.]
MTLKQFLTGKYYTAVKLTKSKTGHLYLDVTINKAKGLFILDTGASATAIEMSKKDHFHLSSKAGKQNASGAGAGDIYVEIAKGCHVQLGKYFCTGAELVLMDLSHVNKALSNEKSPRIDGIIGSDILFKASSIIDYKNLGLFLKKDSKKE